MGKVGILARLGLWMLLGSSAILLLKPPGGLSMPFVDSGRTSRAKRALYPDDPKMMRICANCHHRYGMHHADDLCPAEWREKMRKGG